MILFLSATVFLFFSVADTTLTREERKLATDLLKETKSAWDATKGLSDAQLKFKPASDRSEAKMKNEDVIKHLEDRALS